MLVTSILFSFNSRYCPMCSRHGGFLMRFVTLPLPPTRQKSPVRTSCERTL